MLQLLHDYTRQYACLSYTFIDDEALLDLNRRFLQHDYYTDILTFDLSEKGSGLITGDIYISLERVKDNARQLQVRYQDELLRVILHGALHLAGFKDKKPTDEKNMRLLETQWMQRFQNELPD